MLNNRALANTTFLSGPDEDLATVDAYEVKDDSVINNLPKINADYLADENAGLGDELRGGLAMSVKLPINQNGLLAGASTLKDKASSSGGGLLDKAKALGTSALGAVGGIGGLTKIAAAVAGPSLMSRLGGGSLTGIPGLNSGSLTSLGSILGNGKLPASMTGAFSSPIPSNLGSFANTGSLGGLSSKLLPSQITQSYQMSSLINNVVGGSNPLNIVDKDSTSRLISGLAMGGMSSGLPGSFRSVSTLAGGDRSILASAATAAISFASKSGNIGGIRDIVSVVGKPALSSVSKSTISSVATNFKTTPSTSSNPAQQTRQDFTEVTGAFGDLDEGWMRDDRYKTDPDSGAQVVDYPVVDISLAREGNSNFCSMMQQGAVGSEGNSDLKYFSMATMFPPSSPEDELKKNFPMTYTSITTDTMPNVTTLPEPAPVGPSQDEIDAAKAAKKEEDHQKYLIWAREKNIMVNGKPFNEINGGNGYSGE
jgi:hypothetical protein